ncbi:MAG TPA: hypothetical protein VIC59_00675 [Gemmatimonadota bacterium]|jgi:hypothetical protein
MKQILPGIWHWSRIHETIRIPVHSYYVQDARVLIDPMLPEEGLEWLRKHGPPTDVLLTNRHHFRHSAKLQQTFGVAVRCHRAGLHEFKAGQKVEPFDFGDELPGGILALEVGVLCPEETALLIRREEREGRTGAAGDGNALALGDAVIRNEEGALDFVPDQYIGDDPEGVKRGLKAVFRRLVEEPFKHLLLAHGEPVLGDGRSALKRFAT